MKSPCPVRNTDPWVPWLLQESSTAPSSAFWPWPPKMNFHSAVKTAVPQALVSRQLGPSSQVTSVHCEASEGLMKRCVGRERMDLWTCNHEEAQGLYSEKELGWAHGTGPRVTPTPHKVQKSHAEKGHEWKKERDWNLPRYTHTHTHTCVRTHTRIYLCTYAPLLLFWCCASALSPVWLSATPWTIARQAPLSVGFSRQEYCSGLLFPFLGDLPNPGIKLASPALQADSVSLRHLGILVI